MQSIALDLNTNFTKTAVFYKVRRKSDPNLIILPPLLERYFYTQKQIIPNTVGNEHGGRRKDRNMNNRRIFISLQHFAESAGDGGASANVPDQTADNGGDAQDNASQKPTFDDMLKDKNMQSEFDKRVSKALETAKTKWQRDADEKLSEAKKLEKMNAEQKAEYQRKQTEEKLAKREAEVTKRELMAEAKVQLADKGLPVGLAAVLDYTGADECKTSIETVSKAFAEAVESAVNERMKGNPPKAGSPTGKKDPFLEGLGV